MVSRLAPRRPPAAPLSLRAIQERFAGFSGDPAGAFPLVARRLREAIAQDDNIVGGGFGRRESRGAAGGEVTWTIFVKRQRRGRLPAPARLAGFPAEVVAVGEPTLLGCAESRFRPIPGGVSIGSRYETGTLGGWAWRDTAAGRAWFGLSNNHVLSRWGLVPAGGDVFQPGKADCFHTAPNACGALEQAVDLDAAERRLLVDAAIFRPADPRLISPEVRGIGVPATWRRREDVSLGQRVRKQGRTTGLTAGRISHFAPLLVVKLPGIGRVCLEDQIVCELTTQGGDSGALLFTQRGRGVLGLLCVRMGHLAVANHIQHVQDLLAVQVAPRRWAPR